MAEIMTELGNINVTERAIEEIKKIMQDNNLSPESHALRVGVRGGGCSGLSYSLAFDDKKRENDQEIELMGIKLVIDPKSLFYLGGTTLDFSDRLQGRGFVFNNPNATRTCGCGSSFAV